MCKLGIHMSFLLFFAAEKQPKQMAFKKPPKFQ